MLSSLDFPTATLFCSPLSMKMRYMLLTCCCYSPGLTLNGETFLSKAHNPKIKNHSSWSFTYLMIWEAIETCRKMLFCRRFLLLAYLVVVLNRSCWEKSLTYDLHLDIWILKDNLFFHMLICNLYFEPFQNFVCCPLSFLCFCLKKSIYRCPYTISSYAYP